MMPNDVLMTDTNTVRSGQTTLNPGARLPTTYRLSAVGEGTRVI
jgi:hypothetical protein